MKVVKEVAEATKKSKLFNRKVKELTKQKPIYHLIQKIIKQKPANFKEQRNIIFEYYGVASKSELDKPARDLNGAINEACIRLGVLERPKMKQYFLWAEGNQSGDEQQPYEE
jgi:hypothetical protein